MGHVVVDHEVRYPVDREVEPDAGSSRAGSYGGQTPRPGVKADLTGRPMLGQQRVSGSQSGVASQFDFRGRGKPTQ